MGMTDVFLLVYASFSGAKRAGFEEKKTEEVLGFLRGGFGRFSKKEKCHYVRNNN